MIDLLYNIDVFFFYVINHTLSNPVFDKFFPFITDVKNWYIAYIILWLVAIFKGGRIGKISAIGIIILIVLSDQLSSHLLKPLFERVRPCNALPDVNILINCTHSYSLPSSHAVNNFAAAIFFTRLFPKFKWTFIIVATLAALSRPYVGVHYPSDIIVGAMIGSLIGYIFSIIALKIDELIKLKFPEESG